LIKAIIFDLDNTLLWDERSVKEAFEATCQMAATIYHLDPQRLEEVVRKEALLLYSSYETYEFTKMIGINHIEGLWANFSEGDLESFRRLEKLAPQYRRDAWTNALGSFGIVDPVFGERLGYTFQNERKNRPLLYEDTLEVLESLRGNYQLLLLTNGAPDLQKEKLSGVPSLIPYFENIIISGEYGRGKPDRAIFDHCVNLLNVKKREVIMVGDNLATDILGAHLAGIKSIWVNRAEEVQRSNAVPDYQVHNLKEIVPILQKMSG
jgi:putative hydrolase of the HAD superfamily